VTGVRRRAVTPRWIARALVLALFAIAVVANVTGAGAQSSKPPDVGPPEGAGVGAAPAVTGTTTAGPKITPSAQTLHPGDRVTVTFDGFDARSATLTICGNRAARGSGDCNMVEGQGVRLRHMDVTMVHDMTVVVPPFPCPCVIRAIGVETGEVAIAPIELVGHPVGPVIEPLGDGPRLAVSIHAARDSEGPFGWLRSALGGASPHSAEVTVENLTTETWGRLDVVGSVGRSADDQLASFEMTVDGLAPGATWSGTTVVEVPSPAIGEYTWHATVSGAGQVNSGQSTSQLVPWLLVVLIAVLVADLTAISVRLLKGRAAARRRREDAELDLEAEYVEVREGLVDLRDVDLTEPTGVPPHPGDPATVDLRDPVSPRQT
jgi:hypothetical protein